MLPGPVLRHLPWMWKYLNQPFRMKERQHHRVRSALVHRDPAVGQPSRWGNQVGLIDVQRAVYDEDAHDVLRMISCGYPLNAFQRLVEIFPGNAAVPRERLKLASRLRIQLWPARLARVRVGVLRQRARRRGRRAHRSGARGHVLRVP